MNCRSPRPSCSGISCLLPLAASVGILFLLDTAGSGDCFYHSVYVMSCGRRRYVARAVVGCGGRLNGRSLANDGRTPTAAWKPWTMPQFRPSVWTFKGVRYMHRRWLAYAVPTCVVNAEWRRCCRPVKQFASVNNFVPGCIEQERIIQLNYVFPHDFSLETGWGAYYIRFLTVLEKLPDISASWISMKFGM